MNKFFILSHNICSGGRIVNIIQKIALPFTILVALNWGLVALFNFNLVTWITQGFNIWAKIIYVFIAVCALINIMIFFVDLRREEKIE